MTNLTEYLKRHQLMAYFALTYVFSWTLLIVFQRLFLEGQRFLAPLISLGVFAPALVSIGLSAVLKPCPRQGSRKPAVIAAIVVWILASMIIITHSVVRSFVATLVGVAIDHGYIESVQQPVLGFFPERTVANLDANKEAMTMEDLLTMRAGFVCSSIPTLNQMKASPDWVQFVLDLPMAAEPGTRSSPGLAWHKNRKNAWVVDGSLVAGVENPMEKKGGRESNLIVRLEAAIQSAVTEAAETVQGIKQVYVEGVQAIVEDDEVVNDRVNAKLTFVIEAERA